MRLLLAEDEEELSQALAAVLRHNNYSVDTVYDGQEALDYLEGQEYDGVILDIMMPKKSGIEVLKTIRSHKNQVPVLLLTAKTQVDDRVEGLDAGADDYISKPFGIMELTARVRAVLRRNARGQTLSEYSVGPIYICPDKREASVNGEKVLQSRTFLKVRPSLTPHGQLPQ